MANAKKKTTKLKTENKFTVSLMGSSVPTFLQTLAKKKGVTNAQIVRCLELYLQEDPKFATEFMDEAAEIPTGRKAQATDPETAKAINKFATLIAESENPKQNISCLRSVIKEKNGKTFGYQ